MHISPLSFFLDESTKFLNSHWDESDKHKEKLRVCLDVDIQGLAIELATMPNITGY